MWNVLEFFTGFGDMLFQRDKESQSEELYHPEEVKPHKFSFRPQYLHEYIGQENAKELMKLNFEKIRTIKPVHFIISGSAGCGKSTLAYIIGNAIKFPIHTYIGGAFTMENLQELENKVWKENVKQKKK